MTVRARCAKSQQDSETEPRRRWNAAWSRSPERAGRNPPSRAACAKSDVPCKVASLDSQQHRRAEELHSSALRAHGCALPRGSALALPSRASPKRTRAASRKQPPRVGAFRSRPRLSHISELVVGPSRCLARRSTERRRVACAASTAAEAALATDAARRLNRSCLSLSRHRCGDSCRTPPRLHFDCAGAGAWPAGCRALGSLRRACALLPAPDPPDCCPRPDPTDCQGRGAGHCAHTLRSRRRADSLSVAEARGLAPARTSVWRRVPTGRGVGVPTAAAAATAGVAVERGHALRLGRARAGDEARGGHPALARREGQGGLLEVEKEKRSITDSLPLVRAHAREQDVVLLAPLSLKAARKSKNEDL
ncbi:hypothetical protein T492DRAFT_1141940 [Pavlovales sp. CCMP2436]|nr:hypothetical protein T492DRAFT_1141940 [Pavlovales sp. CCMP2436]